MPPTIPDDEVFSLSGRDAFSLSGRESLSSSDSSYTPSQRPPSQKAPSNRRGLYQTPEGRSQVSAVGAPAKKKLTTVSGGRVCIITREFGPEVSIEAAHLVPRSTPSPMLWKLEFSFGLRYRQLHIDTTRNLAYIRADLHKSFDNNGWFFLPDSDTLNKIKDYLLQRPGMTYKRLFLRAKFEYRIIPLQLRHDNIGVFRRSSHKDSEPAYDRIFPSTDNSPPIVQSHINPFFVIANAGPKLEAGGLGLLTTYWKGHNDISTVILIWNLIKQTTPPPEWRLDPYVDRRDDRQGSHSGDRDRGSPAPKFARSTRFFPSDAAAAGPSPSGGTFGRAVADLPGLDKDDQSDTTDSDVLTHDAVRAVDFVDRSEFFEKWLHQVTWFKARLDLSAIRSRVPVVPPEDVGLATFMAWPRVLHGMPIRDLWAPPQLGRLPTCVAMYFPTPSAAAVDRSLFHRPVPAPFADAVRAVQLPLQSAILIVAFTYPFLLHSLVTPV
ncbi:hypothetical protein DFH08DRAFT_1090579 [Mycena albidolilacea]|uniref:HNH nuclease domain-containing protein n=1 Tax=Mycena albidolilacea TaxID=1033008 RepID=A0AAD7E670_9AGAR|nr:hypothetical protein DFH08DRAFT_1090579 [Mycena albidolilacea]